MLNQINQFVLRFQKGRKFVKYKKTLLYFVFNLELDLNMDNWICTNLLTLIFTSDIAFTFFNKLQELEILKQGCPAIFTSGRNCFIPFSGGPQYRGVHSGLVWIEAFWTQRGLQRGPPVGQRCTKILLNYMVCVLGELLSSFLAALSLLFSTYSTLQSG